MILEFMRRSKKLFLFIAIIFFALLIWASYDISTRTTFPGSKPQLKERIKDNYYIEEPENVKDTIILKTDSILYYDKKTDF